MPMRKPSPNPQAFFVPQQSQSSMPYMGGSRPLYPQAGAQTFGTNQPPPFDMSAYNQQTQYTGQNQDYQKSQNQFFGDPDIQRLPQQQYQPPQQYQPQGQATSRIPASHLPISGQQQQQSFQSSPYTGTSRHGPSQPDASLGAQQ